MGGLSCVGAGQILSTEVQAQGVALTRMIPVSILEVWRSDRRLEERRGCGGRLLVRTFIEINR